MKGFSDIWAEKEKTIKLFCKKTGSHKILGLDTEVKMTYDFEIIRSERRTLALEITEDAKILVRAPRRCPKAYIQSFVQDHADWLDSHLEKQRLRAQNRVELSDEAREMLITRAKKEIPPLVDYYAGIMGLVPASVKITKATKRFGSCSSKNALCFSYRLMQYPQSAIEYVVVHELAHLVHHNHGRDFYELIKSVMPDYKKRDKLLKK